MRSKPKPLSDMAEKWMTIFFKKNLGWLTILILGLLPIVRWLVMLPLNVRFFDANMFMTSLGQMAGLLGMTLFSLNLILSSRLKILDKYFYGLNWVYHYHRIIGTLAFSLLLFHPLFLAVRYITASLRSAALFLLPFTGDPAITYGIVALLLMIGLIAATFYAKIKYQRWKLSHKFMVLVFIFACLHVLLISSDISRDLILRFYILSLAALGLIAGFYRAFLSKFYHRNFSYEIVKITELNKKSLEIELAPIGQAMSFEPGQFIFISFLNSRIDSEIHPFSLTSAPTDLNLKIVIKSLGDYTSELNNLRVGNAASVEGPFGKFSYKNSINKNQIWIAGGIGITPFLSMARDLSAGDYDIDLYYCTKDKAEAVLIDELLAISSLKNNFKVHNWYSDESGRITAQKIMDKSQGLQDKDILLCGPLPFMESLKKQLIDLNVSKRNIHWEKFNFI